MPTTNRAYATPATGSLVDTWGEAALNPNFELIDSNLGAVASVALSSSPVTLSSGQYACGTIRFSGALGANVTVTFPAVSGWWVIDNRTTGNFYVLLTCGAGENIGVPQGCATDILTDGTNVRFRNLAPGIGMYQDFAGSALPNWVSACTVPPFLLPDGTTFSAVTYPILNAILGGNTLPDFRGRAPFYLDGGTGRITTSGSGIDGATRFSSGGQQNRSIGQVNIPSYSLSSSGLSVSGSISGQTDIRVIPSLGSFGDGPTGSFVSSGSSGAALTWSGSIGGSISSGGSGTPLVTMPPAVISGIRMIRAG